MPIGHYHFVGMEAMHEEDRPMPVHVFQIPDV